MARPRKTIEIPGQPSVQPAGEQPDTATAAQLGAAPIDDGAGTDALQQPTQQQPAPEPTTPTDAALAARYALLSMLNARGAAVVARFDELAFTDPAGQPLTSHPAFIALVNQATTAMPAPDVAAATRSEEGAHRATGTPVLTDAGWHVPG
ncbi:hypothetical protein [Mixta calida]|uniref:hypothetical protein n=1 Tax=Mixta calida TaxID=665913 RepID=UPI0034D544C3